MNYKFSYEFRPPKVSEEVILIKAEWPRWARTYVQDTPGKVNIISGGRQSTKSRTVAQLLLLDGMEHIRRVHCSPAITKDTLRIVVRHLGLGGFYTENKQGFLGANGTLFVCEELSMFHGFLSHTFASDIWLDEAQLISDIEGSDLVTDKSLKSRIWITFHPTNISWIQDLMSNRDQDIKSCHVSWRDNVWMSETIEEERRHDEVLRPNEYLHVWEGALLEPQ